jgi:hypothetical protein
VREGTDKAAATDPAGTTGTKGNPTGQRGEQPTRDGQPARNQDDSASGNQVIRQDGGKHLDRASGHPGDQTNYQAKRAA